MDETQANYLVRNETIISLAKMFDFNEAEIEELFKKLEIMNLKERLSLINSLSQMALLTIEGVQLAKEIENYQI